MAVLTYLRRILESLDHPDMINLILHYLLALPDTPPVRRTASSGSMSAARKRKSMDLATMMAEKSESAPTPLLFNLVDLILACLRSHNQQTIHVTLQLISAILKRHHRYAVITLLQTDVLPGKTTHRTVGAHEQEVEYLLSLAASVGGQEDFDAAYENVLQDVMTRLESHTCSLKLIAPRALVANPTLPGVSDSVPGAPRDVREHTLRADDLLLNSLLDLLETFFVNAVDTNLSVTETLVDLAICGYMSIEGWLARSPGGYAYDEDDATATSPTTDGGDDAVLPADHVNSEESERRKGMENCRRRPKWTQQSVPRFLKVLKHLCDQITQYKEAIPRFDELLQQRREAFHTADMMLENQPPARSTPARQGTPERPSLDELSRSGSPSRPSAFEGLAQRLLSELGTPSRSASPRGRKELSRSSGAASPVGALLSTPKGPLVPPKEHIFSAHDPSRSAMSRGLSPSSARDDNGRDSSAMSDASAFAAVDQSILSRKIGLPADEMAPIPLRFDKKPLPEPINEAEVEAEQHDGDAMQKAEDGQAGQDADARSGGDDEEDESDSDEISVSVSHVLTNVIVFQSFLFELASLMQVRAGLFSEVRYV